MSNVWLCLQPPPARPERDSVIDAAYIRGLRTAPLPWKERGQGPHTWALYAFVSGEYDGPVEVLRGAHEGVRRTVARKLAALLGAERSLYPGGSAVVTIGEETPEGFVFHVERQNAPAETRMWWPLEYRLAVEEQERRALAQDAPQNANPLGDTFWDEWIEAFEAVNRAKASAAADGPEESEGGATEVRLGGDRPYPGAARMPWDDDDEPEPLDEAADAQRQDPGEPAPQHRRMPWEEPQE